MTNLVRVEGVNELAARLRGLSDGKIRTATVSALNDGAWAGVKAGQAAMQNDFDRPTRFVLSGIRYVKARKDRLYSSVDLDFWGNKQGVSVEQVLKAEIEGGQRRVKRHEVALQRVGILPAGMFIVPGEAAQIDASGNMAASQINQIIAWFSGFGEQGYKANMTDRTRQRLAKGRRNARGFEYVAILRHRSLPAGIYMRTSFALPGIRKSSTVASSLKPVMIFVKAPSYRRRFDFDGVVSKAARSQFDRSLDAYLATMLKERAL